MNKKSLSAEQMQQEIQKIAEYINQAKGEIAVIAKTENPNSGKNLATAALELNEVVRHTEEATNVIMDNAERIIAIAAGMGDSGVELNTHGLAILETCSFQDITGQRIRKVLKMIDQIELRVGNLIKLFGGTLPEGFKVGAIETSGSERPDEHLMEGPQLAKNKPSQDDVDKLFNS